MTSTRKVSRRLAVVTATILVVASALPPAGGAHSWTLLYKQRWSQADRPVKWVVAPSIHVEHPDWIPYIKQGANQWNSIGSTFQFSYGGVWPNEGNDCGTGTGLSIVRWKFIPQDDPNVLISARTRRCPPDDDGPAKSFRAEFNTAETFYAGAFDPPAGHVDLWAVASHEFGHATGWGPHYDPAPDRSQLCDDSSQQLHTMCPFVEASKQRMRTLEEHDVYTFWNAYPNPDVDPTCVRCLPPVEI